MQSIKTEYNEAEGYAVAWVEDKPFFSFAKQEEFSRGKCNAIERAYRKARAYKLHGELINA